jgi:hypothetical protein
MAKINPGRMTHAYDGELVVFLIGMTINRWWRFDQWLPVFGAMPGMLRELMTDPESGLMGYRLTFGKGGPLLVQYWNSHQKLYAYASDRAALHRPAWSAFNRRIRKAPGTVGIWHETYQVARAESIYVGTPSMGLPAATDLVAVSSRGDRAAARLAAGAVSSDQAAEPAVATPTLG